VSRLSRQCEILNISQTCRPPRPVTGIVLLLTKISPDYIQRVLRYSVAIATSSADGVRFLAQETSVYAIHRSDRVYGPLSHLPKNHLGLFHWGYSGRRVKLITHLNLMTRSRMVEMYLLSPHTYLWRDSSLSTGRTLPSPYLRPAVAVAVAVVAG
jgi:hypothetical protein